MHTDTASELNAVQRLSRLIILYAFRLSVFVVQSFFRMTPYRAKVARWSQLPEGTLGHDIARCLRQHDIQLVPRYESHDLKHVLLGFEMTPEGEIRMQAFMLGNGNHTLPCVAILAFGALLMPERWPTLLAEYQRGSQTDPISTWEIEDYADQGSESLRKEIGLRASRSTPSVSPAEIAVRFCAIVSMAAGAFGMFYCAPHLWSSHLPDLVGAGFPFVGAAILFAAGLVTLGLALQRETSISLQGPA